MEHKCGNCGTAMEADDSFCPECGAKRDQACWSCEAVLEADSMFCGECGARVRTSTTPEHEEPPRTDVSAESMEVSNSTYSLYPDFPEGDFPDEPVEADPLYEQAVEYVLKSRRATISSVQREFTIGYNRSARIIDDMEQEGLVSAMRSDGIREVLVAWKDHAATKPGGVKSLFGRLFGK
jgi:RNA polymerase subunit RPABC4/transcription elongation factor Spt4